MISKLLKKYKGLKSKKYFYCAIELFLFIGVSACSTGKIYIHTTMDSAETFNKKGRILIMEGKDISVEERNFGRFLKQELIKAGYNIVDAAPFEYGLFFSTVKKTFETQSAMPMPTTSYSAGKVGGVSYSGTTQSMAYVPITTTHNIQKIWLNIYSDKKDRNGNYLVIWEGCLGADAESFGKDSSNCLQELIARIGSSFDGNIIVRNNILQSNEKVESYKQSIRLNPDDPNAYFALGDLYRDLGRYQEAAETYKQLVIIKPNDANANSLLASAYVQINRQEDAIPYFKKAVEIDPKDAHNHIELGRCYAVIGDKEAALKQAEIVEGIEPGNKNNQIQANKLRYLVYFIDKYINKK